MHLHICPRTYTTICVLTQLPMQPHTYTPTPSIFHAATNLIGGVDYGNWKEKFDPMMKRYYYTDKATEVSYSCDPVLK